MGKLTRSPIVSDGASKSISKNFCGRLRIPSPSLYTPDDAPFQFVAHSLRPVSQSMKRNTELLGQRATIIDFAPSFILIVFEYQQATFGCQTTQTMLQTLASKIRTLVPRIYRRGFRQFMQTYSLMVGIPQLLKQDHA